MATPTIYRNVESILNVLNNHKVSIYTKNHPLRVLCQSGNIEAVGTLLQVYNSALKNYKENEASSTTTRHPFIVLEGLDGCGKSTICRKLASRLNAAKWCTPPESIKHIRSSFDDHLQLRSAYYALGNYIAALECAVVLKKQPVVMDRYWHSTSCYVIAQAVHDFPGKIEIPPEGDAFYHWPEDLLKPSVVIFLEVNEPTRLQRLSRRQELTPQENLMKKSQQLRDNIILAYRNMVDPEVIFVDSNLPPNKVLAAINERIQFLFK